ncbi:MAG: hypothetical protein ACREON_16040 [Gemmatimonadaceae bacterium]
MRSALVATARGSTARATLEFIRQAYGEALLESVLARLGDETREQVVSAATTAELPYETLLAFWRAADEALGAEHPRWMEDAGAFAVGSLGQRLYGGLWRRQSPVELITQSVSLFRLYYHPGDMVPVEVEAERAVLRLVGFDAMETLFCQRQTGGLRRAAELSGGKDARVKHVRCVAHGDAYCEWEMTWRSRD